MESNWRWGVWDLGLQDSGVQLIARVLGFDNFFVSRQPGAATYWLAGFWTRHPDGTLESLGYYSQPLTQHFPPVGYPVAPD